MSGENQEENLKSSSATEVQKNKGPSWGSLQPDYGSTPKKVRRVPVKRFDPLTTATTLKLPSRPSKLSPKDLDFWETVDTYVIDEDSQIFAKKVYQETARCQFIYIGQRTSTNKMRKIRFSAFEGIKKIVPYAEELLIQIDAHHRSQLPDEQPVRYFADNPQRPYEWDPKNEIAFWQNPDLDLPSVRVRCQFNGRNGQWEFGFNNAISDEAQEKWKNWPGPVVWLNEENMTALLSFIEIA